MTIMNYRQTLESVGVPISLSSQIAVILQRGIENPDYQRSPEEQETVSHGWTWWAAQSCKTVNHRGEGR